MPKLCQISSGESVSVFASGISTWVLPKNLGLLKSTTFLPVELHLGAGFPGVSSSNGWCPLPVARCPLPLIAPVEDTSS